MDRDDLANYVKDAKNGNASAWGTLITLIKEVVTLKFRWQLRKGAEIDDLIQEVCLRVFSKLNLLRDNSGFLGFVMTTAQRVLLDQRRERRHWLAFAVHRYRGEGCIDAFQTSLEINELIDRCYQWLQAPDRPYFTDFFVKGLADREIAAKTGCSELALRIRRYRIRSTLRPKLIRAMS